MLSIEKAKDKKIRGLVLSAYYLSKPAPDFFTPLR